MAGEQGMAFTAGGLPSSANKERPGFCWDDAGSADFFDQYVELGDSDADSAAGAGGSGGFGQFGGASGLLDSPHLSFGHLLPPDGAHGAGALVVNNSKAASANSAARISRGQYPIHPLYRAATNMTAFGNPEAEPNGLYGGFEGPGGGSISDLELLKLEGLRMRSPHIPPLPASEPASPPSRAATSPRKASRLENFCTKIRNKAATLHGKGKQAEAKEQPSVPVMSTAQMEPARTGRRPQNLHISKAQLPSPPLTSGMPSQGQPGQGPVGDACFVNGFLDDPFLRGGLLNGQFVPPLHLNGSTMPQTPLSTPLLDWQLRMATPNGKPLWTGPSPYYSGEVNGDASNTWWDPSAVDAMDTDPPPLPYHTAADACNLAIQLQHQQSFEYPAPPGTEDTTFGPDLMLHMPQPRGIPSAVLHEAAPASRPTRADHRRPKPRAPSSGARHHQYAPGMSPRKGRAASGGSSTRRGSVSPGPKAAAAAAPASSGGAGRLHQRSASMHTLNQPASAGVSLPAEGPAHSAAVRKRRSWTGRRTSSSSSSLHHQYHTLAAAAAVAGNEPVSSPGRRRTNTTASASSSSHPGYQSHSHSHSQHSLPDHVSFPNQHSAFPAHHQHRNSSHYPNPHHNTPYNNTNTNNNTNNNNNNPTTTRPRPRPSRTHTTRNQTPPNHPPPRTAAAAAATKATHQEPSSQEPPHKETQKEKNGFVNYTPQDHTLLMTGVAPSGSSKTKARREREAAERQREFRERLARMVRAAGGDVRRLGGGGSSSADDDGLRVASSYGGEGGEDVEGEGMFVGVGV
jgi:hypothetical protein